MTAEMTEVMLLLFIELPGKELDDIKIKTVLDISIKHPFPENTVLCQQVIPKYGAILIFTISSIKGRR